jgi:hypothetical protein
MALISKKKIIYPVSLKLRKYLQKYGREVDFPIHYADLLRYSSSIPLYDSKGNEIYAENSDGSWCKCEYDSKGNKIYYEKPLVHLNS